MEPEAYLEIDPIAYEKRNLRYTLRWNLRYTWRWNLRYT